MRFLLFCILISTIPFSSCNNQSNLKNSTELKAEEGIKIAHQLIKNKDKEGQLPLYIYIHGYGGGPSEVLSLGEHLIGDNVYYGIQGPYPFGNGAYSWYDLEFKNNRVAAYDTLTAQKSLEQIADLIRGAKENPKVNKDRIYLIGFSQGAMLTLEMINQYPELIAGGIAICGKLANNQMAMPEISIETCEKDVFILAGNKDSRIEAEDTEDIKNYYASCLNIRFKSFNAGHEISPIMLNEMSLWMIEQENKWRRATDQ